MDKGTSITLIFTTASQTVRLTWTMTFCGLSFVPRPRYLSTTTSLTKHFVTCRMMSVFVLWRSLGELCYIEDAMACKLLL